MFAAYLALRWWRPRYAVIAALAVGVAAVVARSGSLRSVSFALARPKFVAPVFSWQAILGVALPLFVVTMASQNLPGVAVLKDAGYIAPVSRAVSTTGIATLVLAPFGCFALNLAAITAAICTSRSAHPLPERRFVAACWAGVFYISVGLFGGVVVALLLMVPPSFVLRHRRHRAASNADWIVDGRAPWRRPPGERCRDVPDHRVRHVVARDRLRVLGARIRRGHRASDRVLARADRPRAGGVVSVRP